MSVHLANLLAALLALTGQAHAEPPADQPDPAPGVSYPLVLQDGRPILKCYDFMGHQLCAALDTGSPGSISLTKELFTSCVPGGAVDSTSLDGLPCLHLAALGSGRLRQMPVESLEDIALIDDETEASSGVNSIFPLDMIDGDCVCFLLSQSRLWVGDRLPEPSSDIDVQIIPYIEWMTGILLPVKGMSRISYLQLDTGSDATMFYRDFLTQEPALFGGPHARVESGFLGSTLTGNMRRLRHSITVLGQDKQNDGLKIPRGEYAVVREKMDDGSSVAAGNSPYDRPDRPRILAAGVLGMDVLGQYDFALLRREKLLLVWDPAQTAQIFPLAPVAAASAGAGGTP